MVAVGVWAPCEQYLIRLILRGMLVLATFKPSYAKRACVETVGSVKVD